MHPCPGNWVAIGRAVVYYARAAQALDARIKCQHCILGKQGLILLSVLHMCGFDVIV